MQARALPASSRARHAACRPHPAPHPRSARAAAAAAPVPPGQQQHEHSKARALEMHVSGDTTVSVPIGGQAVQQLQGAVAGLLQTFAQKQKAERPQRWPMMEWRYKSSDAPDSASELELFEVFCNPNGFGTAFEARALLTLRTKGGLKITSEAKLSSLQADIEAYLQQG